MAGNSKHDFLSKKHTELKVRGIDYKSFLICETVYTVARLEEIFAANGKVFGFDTETTNLDPEKAKIAGYSFSFDGVTGYYVPLRHVRDNNAPLECLTFIVNKICDNSYNVLMFNKKYDLNILEIAERYNIGTRYNVYDVQALIWLRDTEIVMPSLKWSSEHFLGITQPTFLETVGDMTFDYAIVADVFEYACLDAVCTVLLYYDTIKKHPYLRNIFLIDNLSIEAMRRFEHQKVRLDYQYLLKEDTRVIMLIKDIERQIFDLTGYEFNVNSPNQKADALIKAGIVLTEKTKGGAWCTDADVLEKIEHPLAKLMAKHGSETTYHGTFVKKLKDYAEKDNGRIRFNYKTMAVVTGRFSSGGDKTEFYSNINGQNIPKPRQEYVIMARSNSYVTGWDIAEYVPRFKDDNEKKAYFDQKLQQYGEFYVSETGTPEGHGVRTAFIPEDGHEFVSIDYSGQELRIATILSREPVWVNAFLNNEDIHMQTAKGIWGHNSDGNHRKKAKNANFFLLYGGGAYSWAKEYGGSKAEAQGFINDYNAGLPKLTKWKAYQIRQARAGNDIFTIFGRPRRMARFFKDKKNRGMMAFGERTSLNTPIQGTGGDVIRYELGELRKFMDKYPYVQDYFRFISTVHDEINFSVNRNWLNEFMKFIPKMMTLQFENWPIPLVVGVEIGRNWCQAVKYNFDTNTCIYTPDGDHYKLG